MKARFVLAQSSRRAIVTLALASLWSPIVHARQQPALAGSLQAYVGNLYLVRNLSRAPEIRLKADNPSIAAGSCDAAVSVMVANYASGAVVLKVEPVGSPQIEQRAPIHCTLARQINISISGFAPHASSEDVTAAIATVLLSPEAYLESYGIHASESSANGDPETPLGQSSMIGFAPPQPLLSVYADYTDAVKKGGVSGNVVVQATIGRDGRIYSASVLNGLGDALDQQVLRLYRLWLLRPARVEAQNVAFQLNLETQFH